MEKHKWFKKRGTGLRRNTQPHDLEIKRKVVKEYVAGGISYSQLSKKYGIGKSSIIRWVQLCEGIEQNIKYISASPNDIQVLDTSLTFMGTRESSSQESEIAALKKALEREKLKNEALEAMIDLAEEEFKLPVRKKSYTKPSN